jgi:hypothetical protein
MATIEGITGKQFVQGGANYKINAYQYATSSHADEGYMNPALVIYPTNVDDIRIAIKHAKQKKIAIAVRTGGHQYSGASSTAAPNIQLDLSETFRSEGDRKIVPAPNPGETWLRTSVSWSLGEFNKYLKANKLFIAHGQCTNVHLGGHVQTGGVGQLGRSFGLFGDHARILTIVDSDGNLKDVTKSSDPDLFFALLGGSPGNFGVVTHITLQVHRDQDYKGALGLKAMWFYSKDQVQRLLTILCKMSDDPNFPRNYDLCVSVLSSSFKLPDLFPEVDGMMRLKHPEIYGESGMVFWPRIIIVYAQYIPFSPNDKPDMNWFREIEKDSFFTLGVQSKPMSAMTGDWIFTNIREFDHPYNKRAYLTSSTTLTKDGWPAYIAGRIDAIVKPDDNDCYLSCQIQPFGGVNSMFFKNRTNGTAYSWRDTTVCAVLDAFYGKKGKAFADNWQKENDKGMIGEKSTFSKQDKRTLWGSYGEFALDKVWMFYHESKEKYERLGKVRGRVDKDGLWTPNAFAVKRIMQ